MSHDGKDDHSDIGDCLEALRVRLKKFAYSLGVVAEDLDDLAAEVIYRVFARVRESGQESIRNLESYAMTTARNLVLQARKAELQKAEVRNELLKRTKSQETSVLTHALSGVAPQTDPAPASTLRLVREAIGNLPPRVREFLTLDLIECRSPETIRKCMNFRSYKYYATFKCTALKALRLEIKKLIDREGLS